MPTRVLVCDDAGLTTLRYRTTLTRRGFEMVGVAGDGNQVIEEARRLKPDAILMDIEMPNLDGIAATRCIMEEHPTAIVIISAYSEPGTIEAAMAAGASGYLIKPVSDEQIEPAIHAALQRFGARKLH